MTGHQPEAPAVPGVTRWRKKPVEVEAILWTGENRADVATFTASGVRPAGEGIEVWNEQERAWIPCPVGHRIVRGQLGEFYPISPAAVAATYEPAGGASQVDAAGSASDDTSRVRPTAPEASRDRTGAISAEARLTELRSVLLEGGQDDADVRRRALAIIGTGEADRG